MSKTVLIEVIREGGFDRSGRERTLMTHTMTESEWEEMQRQAQLGRMVERMKEGSELHNEGNWRYVGFDDYIRAYGVSLGATAKEALRRGGISDE